MTKHEKLLDSYNDAYEYYLNTRYPSYPHQVSSDNAQAELEKLRTRILKAMQGREVITDVRDSEVCSNKCYDIYMRDEDEPEKKNDD